jgi:excisionase family DNA binding protein
MRSVPTSSERSRRNPVQFLGPLARRRLIRDSNEQRPEFVESNAAAADHADRLVQALRYEPCSPGCANWLRYGINPKNPRPGMRPGHCRGKAHRRAHLGYAGRRVLVSRRWSGKTLTEHKADRRAWLLAMLGLPDLPATDAGRYTWHRVTPGDPTTCQRRRRCSTSSPTDPDRKPPSLSPANEQAAPAVFRQLDGGSVMTRQTPAPVERLLTVGQVAELLGTTERFPRRLIAERRIRFVRVGRHIRIPESAVANFVAAEMVEPGNHHRRGVA